MVAYDNSVRAGTVKISHPVGRRLRVSVVPENRSRQTDDRAKSIVSDAYTYAAVGGGGGDATVGKALGDENGNARSGGRRLPNEHTWRASRRPGADKSHDVLRKLPIKYVRPPGRPVPGPSRPGVASVPPYQKYCRFEILRGTKILIYARTATPENPYRYYLWYIYIIEILTAPLNTFTLEIFEKLPLLTTLFEQMYTPSKSNRTVSRYKNNNKKTFGRFLSCPQRFGLS